LTIIGEDKAKFASCFNLYERCQFDQKIPLPLPPGLLMLATQRRNAVPFANFCASPVLCICYLRTISPVVVLAHLL
jgi:hypothetical protein